MDCRPHSIGGLGVLSANVDIGVFAAYGVGGNRHGLHNGIRVTFHENPVLECPRFGLVRVADQVLGSGGR